MASVTINLPAHELAEEIKRRRNVDLASKINQYQRKNSILSDISECERQMTYSVLNWQEKPLHDEHLQARFDAGNLWEKEITSKLLQMGFDFIMAQAPVTIQARDGSLIGSGKIDGFIVYNGAKIPVEIKSMHPNIYNDIESLEDFQKKPWLRKYVRQLMMYLYANNLEWGIFIITDCLGHWNVFPMALDFGEAEYIIQRLERVAINIANKTYPDRIPYSREMCDKCPFATTCLQDIINEGFELIDMPDLVTKRKRMDAIESMADEYEKLDKDTKAVAKKVGKDFIVGTDYKVEIKRITVNRTDLDAIPPEIKMQYQTTGEQIRVNFVPLKAKEAK